MNRKIRILLATGESDGENKELKRVARHLRDCGCEVIFAEFPFQAPIIAQVSIQEDVDAIGIWWDARISPPVFVNLIDALKEQGADEIAVFGGGRFTSEEEQELREAGVKKLFGHDAEAQLLTAFVLEEAAAGRRADG
jgi:methylmalonyl-CoA mutase, C-terminal domain